MRKLLNVAVTLLACTCAFAQENRPLSEAGITICEYAKTGGGTGKWVTSKQGFSATVELRARVSGRGQKRRCTTLWTLQLRQPGGKPHSLNVAERMDIPEDDEWIQENSFEINAWSPDGSLLLTSQIEAQGDWDETTPIIYDFKTDRHWRLPLQPLFEKFIPSECYVLYRPLRFTQSGEVLVSASSTDDDRAEGTKPCFAESLWAVDYVRNRITRVHSSPTRR